MHDDLCIGLGAEAMAFCFERFLQLAIVLDDAVEHDRKPAVLATRQRVRVLLVDGAVRRPARVTETVIRLRAVRARCVLQELEVADGAHVLEAAVLAQRDAGRVVAAVLEPLETVEQQLLRSPATNVPDDPAHPKLLSVAAPCLQRWIEMLQLRGFPKTGSRKRQKPGCAIRPFAETVSRALVARELRSYHRG